MTDLQQLAADVLAMFDEQAVYFKARDPAQLNKCKSIEARLRKRCKAILDPPKKQSPGLFQSDQTDKAEF